MLEQEVRTQRNKFNAVVTGVKPVLNCINLEAAPQPGRWPPHPDTIIERCKAAWENFKSFNRDTIITAASHALVVVRSHYPAIDLQAIGARFAEGMGEAEHQQLEDKVEDAAKKLPGDIDLFGETEGDGEAR